MIAPSKSKIALIVQGGSIGQAVHANPSKCNHFTMTAAGSRGVTMYDLPVDPLNRHQPTHPLLAAFVVFLISVFIANIVVRIAFEETPDIYVLPAEYGIPLLLAVMSYSRRNRSRMIAPLACRVCSYNLSGNISGRCPECGTALNR
jgi:hypothetical protein